MGQFSDLFDTSPEDIRANANLRFGADVQPDVAARKATLARRFGVPEGVIEQYQPDYEARAKVEDAAPLLEQSPRLRGWLAADAGRAKVVHDDLENMGAVESTLRYLFTVGDKAPRGGLLNDVSRAGRSVASGAPTAGAGLYGLLAAPAGLVDQGAQMMDDAAAWVTGTARRPVVGTPGPEQWLLGQQKSAQDVAKAWAGVDPNAGWAEKAVMSGFQSAGQNLITVPVGFAPVGGTRAMLGAMGAMTGGQSYGKGREAGLAPGQAAAYGLQDAAAEIVTERFLGAAGFLRNVKAGASVGKLFAYEVFKEVPGEIGATLWQNFNEWTNVNPDKSLADFIGEQPEAIRDTVISTLVGGTTQIGTVKAIERAVMSAEQRAARAQQAEETSQRLAQLNELATASKVLARDPQTFEQFVREADASDVFISAQTLAQSGLAEQVAAVSPSVAAQLAPALASGGDIRIPVSEYAARIAPTEYAQGLLDHLKTDPGGYSRAEAQQYMQSHAGELQQEVERVLAAKQGDETFKASTEAVKAEIKTQLDQAGRFTPQVNDAYASMVGNFYAVMAAKLGISSQDLFARYPLKVAVERIAGEQQFDQQGRLAIDTPAFKEWFGDSKVADADGKPLVVYHGTAADFSVFDASAEPRTYESDRGKQFFTSSPADASGYATSEGAGGNVMPVYLSLQNPRIETTDGDPSQWWDENGKQAWDFDVAGKHDGIIVSGSGGRTLYVTGRPEQIKSATGNRGTFDPTDASILHQSENIDVADPELGISHVLLELGRLGEVFQSPRSAATDMKAIVADKGGMQVKVLENSKDEIAAFLDGLDVVETDLFRDPEDPNDPMGEQGRRALLAVQAREAVEKNKGEDVQVWEVTLANGGTGSVTQVGQNVYINVATLKEGGRGNRVYDLAANYAFTNGLKFIGDPNGLSGPGLRRRTENMLSAAIKYGSTDFLVPHPYQLEGDTELGVPPLHWTEGDTLGNIRALVDVSIAATEHTNPKAFDELRYDPAAQSFVDGQGQPVGKEELFDILSNDPRVPGIGQAGSTTLQRAALFRALLSGPDARRQFLDAVRGKRGDGSAGIGRVFYQSKVAPGDRGAFNPATNTITLLKGADLSTFLHESGHFFLETQFDLASRLEGQRADGATLAPGEQQILTDTSAVLKWFGVESLDAWYGMDFEVKRSHHEQFARGFEAYLFEGKAPSIELQGLFQRFRAWLLNVYRDLKALNVELTDEVRGVFDRMLATNEAIQVAEQGRSMMPLFTSADQAGMTPEEFAAYHDLGVQATADAIEELQTRGLRDMRWLHNAKGREVKRLQKEAAARRAEVRMEARAEVMSQPVYRAWQFLTNKLGKDDKLPKPVSQSSDGLDETRDSLFTAIAKLGGLDRAQAENLLGWPKGERSPQPGFGKYLLRREGGLSVDAMAERLAEAGYLPLDENGKHDPQDFEGKFDAERRGDPQYSIAKDYADAHEKRAGDGLNLEALAAGRLDITELKSMGLPAEIAEHLQNLKMTAQNGIHPDLVAEMFGFTSGDEMVRTLAAAEAPAVEIEGLTDQRMLERYGDLSSPEALDRAADKALHNDARSRMVATEANALEKAVGKPRTMASAAREFARVMISRLKVRDLRPGQYAAAEVRAAKAAEKARIGGDLATAAAEKRNQLVNNYATRSAYDAQDEVEKGVRYLRKFDRDIKGLDADYADQIHALLERFDLRAQSLKAIDKRAALADWIKAQREQGLEPDIPSVLENEAFRKSYRDLTVEEFQGLVDTVRQIEHLGRLKNRLLTAADNRAYEAVRDEITASITTNAGDRAANTRTPTTNLGRVAQQLKRFWAAHIKAATWARVMDGGKDGGAVWEYLVRPANERGDQETTMRHQATTELTAILAPVFKLGRMGGAGQFFSGIGRSLNREARIAIALNTGNEGNLQRLLGGEGWTVQQIQPVLQSLTAVEWQAVQTVWDHFEQYRPLIAAKERRIYGKEPQWVEAQPFHMKTADGATAVLRGGYYPIKYDPAASQRAEEHADAEAARRQLQGAYTSATTRRSFTKARVEEVSGRPLLYTLAGLYSGVNDVIHDLAWHEWLIDANRLLRSKSIDSVIREHYGPEAKQQLKAWVNDIAEGERGADNAAEMALGRLRQGVSAAGLGFNVVSAAMQVLGFNQSVVRVGARWVGRGVARYVASPLDTTREVLGKSKFMTDRVRTQMRELNELRNRVQDQSTFNEYVGRYSYFLMARAQQMVDVPTWVGAYEKAISEGNVEERAIALSDQAVIDSQGSGMVKDLSSVERGGPALRLFTAFYSYMNTALNMGAAQAMTAKGRGKLAADMLLLYTVPAVLGALLRDAITPGDADDDDDWGALARRLAAEQLNYLLGLMVVAREFGQAAKIVTGAEGAGRDYSGPAGVRVISDTYRFGQQAAQGEFDDAFRKASINLLGDLTGLPAAQTNRIVTGVNALREGQTSNPAAVVFGYQQP